jgi:4-hydroxy-tetrahydrodipicolinate synthase
VYELERASGYSIPVSVVERLRETVDNVAGMKVSDTPFEKVAPYLLEGLDVYIGAEALIGQGLSAGAAGAVSGLASAFPEVVSAAVRSGDSTDAGRLRALIEGYPRHAALKAVVRARGVAVEEDVRPPLRGLTDEEREALLAAVL